MRRQFYIAVIALLFCGLRLASASAQTFPSGRVTIITPYAAGGTADIIARPLADGLSKLWKVPVIVENISGAGGLLGTARAAKADPDGLTLLITVQDPLILNRFLFKNLPYDPDKSLTPVVMIARSPQIVIANASFPANSMSELIDVARRTPGGITYSSSGLGSQPYLLFETIAKHDRVKFVHVPYKGIAPAVLAVMTGEVQVATGSPPSAGPMIEDGRVKALAISGTERSKRFPNVPTLSEAGFANLDQSTWWGLFAPAGMNAKLVDRINHDVASIAKQPDFIAKHFEKLGIEPVLDSPAEFSAAIRSDVATTAEMVKAAGIQPLD